MVHRSRRRRGIHLERVCEEGIAELETAKTEGAHRWFTEAEGGGESIWRGCARRELRNWNRRAKK